MDKEASKVSGIDAQGQESRHGPTPQINTPSSSPRLAYPKPDKASHQHLSSPTAPRRLSPLGDLGTLISKSQLHRRISPQPPLSPDRQSTALERQNTLLSADQAKLRRATVGPDFLAQLLHRQTYGESNSMSHTLDLSSSSTTGTTIPAPINAVTPIHVAKSTDPSTPTPHPQRQIPQPGEPNMFIPPLTLIHFHCYQSHRNMKRSSNIHAPVPCMVCRIGDMEMRWKCTWCCLRICGACMQRLENVRGKDLTSLVQRLGRGRRRSQGY